MSIVKTLENHMSKDIAQYLVYEYLAPDVNYWKNEYKNVMEEFHDEVYSVFYPSGDEVCYFLKTVRYKRYRNNITKRYGNDYYKAVMHELKIRNAKKLYDPFYRMFGHCNRFRYSSVSNLKKDKQEKNVYYVHQLKNHIKWLIERGADIYEPGKSVYDIYKNGISTNRIVKPIRRLRDN